MLRYRRGTHLADVPPYHSASIPLKLLPDTPRINSKVLRIHRASYLVLRVRERARGVREDAERPGQVGA